MLLEKNGGKMKKTVITTKYGISGTATAIPNDVQKLLARQYFHYG